MTPPLLPTISYHQQRLRHARSLLLAWLRRWGAYLGAFALVWAVGADSPLALLAAALGALALPMLHAAQQAAATPAALLVLALTGLGYTAAGLVPVLATRPLWWPAHWAQAEAALPLPPTALRASDLRMLACLLGPWLGLQGAGLAALLMVNPRLLAHGALPALAGLLLAGAAAAALGLLHMRRLRHRAAGRGPGLRLRLGQAGHGQQAQVRRATAPRVLVPSPWYRVLLWWPLWRGVARRSGHALLAGGLASPALAAGPVLAPAATGWWLAGLAVCTLACTAWLRARCRVELAPLHAACRALPLGPLPLARGTQRLSLLPAALGLAVAAPVLAKLATRPLVALAYLLWLAGSCLLESRPPPADAQHHALRWLFCLVLAVALGSELRP